MNKQICQNRNMKDEIIQFLEESIIGKTLFTDVRGEHHR